MTSKDAEQRRDSKSESDMKSCYVSIKRSNFTEEEIAEMKAYSVEASESEVNADGESSSDDKSSSDDESSSSESGDKKPRKTAKNCKKLSCSECKKEFNTHQQLVNHVDHKHTAFPFKCVICKSTFKMRINFSCHMKSQHPEMGMYACDYRKCGESFSKKKQLTDHKKVHFQYVCRFCKKRYVMKRQMLQHVSEVH